MNTPKPLIGGLVAALLGSLPVHGAEPDPAAKAPDATTAEVEKFRNILGPLPASGRCRSA